MPQLGSLPEPSGRPTHGRLPQRLNPPEYPVPSSRVAGRGCRDVMPTFRSAEASRRGGLHDDERCYWPLGSSAIDFTVSVWPSTVPVTITFHDLSLSVALMNASACSLPFGSNFSTLWSAVIRL